MLDHALIGAPSFQLKRGSWACLEAQSMIFDAKFQLPTQMSRKLFIQGGGYSASVATGNSSHFSTHALFIKHK